MRMLMTMVVVDVVVSLLVVVLLAHLMRLFSPRTWKNSPDRERDTDLIFSFTMFVTPDIFNLTLA